MKKEEIDKFKNIATKQDLSDLEYRVNENLGKKMGGHFSTLGKMGKVDALLGIGQQK